jgi:hypothetical protein
LSLASPPGAAIWKGSYEVESRTAHLDGCEGDGEAFEPSETRDAPVGPYDSFELEFVEKEAFGRSYEPLVLKGCSDDGQCLQTFEMLQKVDGAWATINMGRNNFEEEPERRCIFDNAQVRLAYREGDTLFVESRQYSGRIDEPESRCASMSMETFFDIYRENVDENLKCETRYVTRAKVVE